MQILDDLPMPNEVGSSPRGVKISYRHSNFAGCLELVTNNALLLCLCMQLEFLREMKMTWGQCSEVLMVSRTTLWRRCQALGLISIHSGPRISDVELHGRCHADAC